MTMTVEQLPHATSAGPGPAAQAASLERILRASRAFGGLDEPLLRELARTSTRRALRRGDAVWHRGDPATHFLLILSGLVEVVSTSPDGGKTILAIYGPRETIGDVVVVERGAYPTDAVVSSEWAQLLRIDAGPVLSALHVRADVGCALNTALLTHTHALQSKIDIMTAGAVPKRLAMLLLHLAERFGDEMPNGTTHIPVSLSRAELARLVGATVETTIRTMCRWQRAGLVATTPEGFTLHNATALLDILKRRV